MTSPIEAPQGSIADTGHHMWHEVIETFGAKAGTLLVIAAVLAGIWLWRRRK